MAPEGDLAAALVMMSRRVHNLLDTSMPPSHHGLGAALRAASYRGLLSRRVARHIGRLNPECERVVHLRRVGTRDGHVPQPPHAPQAPVLVLTGVR